MSYELLLNKLQSHHDSPKNNPDTCDLNWKKIKCKWICDNMHDDVRKTHMPLPHLSLSLSVINRSIALLSSTLKITIKNDGDADSHICYVDFYDCPKNLTLHEQTLSDMRLVRRIPISVVSGGTAILHRTGFWHIFNLFRHCIAVVHDPILDPIDFTKIEPNRHILNLGLGA